MAKRVTPEEIVEMHRLYAKYGNYAAVGRVQMGGEMGDGAVEIGLLPLGQLRAVLGKTDSLRINKKKLNWIVCEWKTSCCGIFCN